MNYWERSVLSYYISNDFHVDFELQDFAYRLCNNSNLDFIQCIIGGNHASKSLDSEVFNCLITDLQELHLEVMNKEQEP